MEDDDFVLLARAKAGDDHAWGILVDRHCPSVRRFFAHRVSADHVDDLTQDTFLRLEPARDEDSGVASFRSFLFGIAWNVFREFLRKQARGPRVDLEGVSAVDLDPRPSALLVQRVERLLLLEGLRRLSLPHQLVLELFYWEGLSGREIGLVLGEPENTVRGRVTKARHQLREILRELDEMGTAPRETDTGIDDWARQLREEAVPAVLLSPRRG